MATENSIQAIGFDYSSLSSETKALVEECTQVIREKAHQSVQNTMEVGHRLAHVKAALPHGEFRVWLAAEFNWSHDTAYRMMNVAKNLGEIPHSAEFDTTALYLLAAPSTPKKARTVAMKRARNGERITKKVAQEIRREAKLAETVVQGTATDKKRTVRNLEKNTPETSAGNAPIMPAQPPSIVPKPARTYKSADRVQLCTTGLVCDVVSVYADGRISLKARAGNWRSTVYAGEIVPFGEWKPNGILPKLETVYAPSKRDRCLQLVREAPDDLLDHYLELLSVYDPLGVSS